MKRTRNELLQQIDKLARALDARVPGREREWTENVNAAFAHVEDLLRQHYLALRAPDGLLATVQELAPETLPTLDRRLNGFLQEESDFLNWAKTLREEIQNTLQAFTVAMKPNRPLVPVTSEPFSIADFGALREQLRRFVDAVRQHQEAETKLVLETVNTDIGVGD
jgi:hypothetical protein